MAKRKNSPFAVWFKRQYGRMPNEARIQELYKERSRLHSALADVEALLHAEQTIASHYQHALYGWNAAPEERHDFHKDAEKMT